MRRIYVLIIAIRIVRSIAFLRIMCTATRVVRTTVLPLDADAATIVSLDVGPCAAMRMIRTIPCLGVDQTRMLASSSLARYAIDGTRRTLCATSWHLRE